MGVAEKDRFHLDMAPGVFYMTLPFFRGFVKNEDHDWLLRVRQSVRLIQLLILQRKCHPAESPALMKSSGVYRIDRPGKKFRRKKGERKTEQNGGMVFPTG